MSTVPIVIAMGFTMTMNVSFAGPAGAIHYPDLQTLPPSDIGIEYDAGTGRKLLHFSNTIANLGEGPMEIIPTNNAAAGTTDAYQRLYSHDDNGQWHVASTKYVGKFIFHPQHEHWHFEDFARYELHNVAADGSIGGTVLSSSEKVSFCLTDSIRVDTALEHAGPETYLDCGQTLPQGISVGWADVYTWDLYGQSLDITGIPDGDYWLVSTADPDDLLNEGGGAFETNNTGALKVRIGNELVWIDDAVPAGAIANASNDSWTWIVDNPKPFSGLLAHQSDIGIGPHEHHFAGATSILPVNPGNILFAYVYLDPINLPSEVMLGWSDGFYSGYGAYWGDNEIGFDPYLMPVPVYLGPLPPAGQWVRLEVPARLIGLEGVAVTGMSFALFDGRATWDYAGIQFAPDSPPPADTTPPTVAITAPTNNATVSGVVAVSADVADDVSLAGVLFKVDGASLGPPITAAPYQVNWDTSSTASGSHTLTAVATDAAGNEAASSPVSVVVSNNAAPTVAAPDSTVLTCSPPDGSEAMVSVEVRDSDGDPLTVIWNVDGATVLTNLVSASGPPTTADLTFARTFTPGAHAVRVTVSDGKDSATAETKVTVEADGTAPVITSVSASPDVLWPPDHRMVPVTVNVSASDACGDFTSRIIEVTSNEPPSSPFSGDAGSGWEITGPLSAYLRAERSGAGGGRVYSITIECQDTAGNRTTQNVTVGVPPKRF